LKQVSVRPFLRNVQGASYNLVQMRSSKLGRWVLIQGIMQSDSAPPPSEIEVYSHSAFFRVNGDQSGHRTEPNINKMWPVHRHKLRMRTKRGSFYVPAMVWKSGFL
jgi:hypothetical protein